MGEMRKTPGKPGLRPPHTIIFDPISVHFIVCVSLCLGLFGHLGVCFHLF